MELGEGVGRGVLNSLVDAIEDDAVGEQAIYAVKVRHKLFDLLVVTSRRLVGLHESGVAVREFTFDQIHDTAYDITWSKVWLGLEGGLSERFKLVHTFEMPLLRFEIEDARAEWAEGRGAHSDLDRPDGDAESTKAPWNPKVARVQLREKQAQEWQQAKDSAGRLVASETFGIYRVELYERGAVRVSPVPLIGVAEYERLLSIDSSTEVATRSALDRGAVAVLSLRQVSLGKHRGDVYLTIATDSRVHNLRSKPSVSNIRAGRGLAAAGAVVLSQTARRSVQTGQPLTEAPQERSLPVKLRELASLRDDGLITDDEYTVMRQRALDIP